MAPKPHTIRHFGALAKGHEQASEKGGTKKVIREVELGAMLDRGWNSTAGIVQMEGLCLDKMPRGE